MTKLGKFLVFFNLGVSLALAIWAMSLYLHRIDWSNEKGKDGRPDGQLVERIARVKSAWYPMLTTERDWRETRRSLVALEDRRRETRRWYEAELAKLEKDPNAKNPAQQREIVYDITGQPDLEVGGDPDPKYPGAIRVKMKAATDNGWIVNGKKEIKPLRAKNLYDLQETEIFEGGDMKPGLLAERTRHRKGVENQVETVTRMLGPTGLHTRLTGEKLKREGVVEEYDAAKPLLINTAASSTFAIERVKELEARVQELEEKRNELRRKLGIAGGPDQ
jgi:hypothetical protein